MPTCKYCGKDFPFGNTETDFCGDDCYYAFTTAQDPPDGPEAVVEEDDIREVLRDAIRDVMAETGMLEPPGVKVKCQRVDCIFNQYHWCVGKDGAVGLDSEGKCQSYDIIP